MPMVVDPVNVPPKATFPLDPVNPLLADIRTGTTGVVATPLTVETRFPLVAVKALLPIMMASVVASTPFIVVRTVFTVGLETRVLPIIMASVVAGTLLIVVLTVFTVGFESVLLFISATLAPATPLIMVLKLLTEEVLTTVLTAGVVAAIPFTVEVMVFIVLSKILVVWPLPFDETTRLPEASNPNPFAIVPLVGVKSAETPFTVLVSFPDVPVNILELIIFVEFPAIPLTIVDKIFPVEVLETVVLAATIGLKSTAVVVIPFTLVVKLFPIKVFATDVTAGAVAITPFIVEVRIFVVLSSVLVVGVLPAVTKFPVASKPKLWAIAPFAGIKSADTPFTVLVSFPEVPANVFFVVAFTTDLMLSAKF